jgi:hypothetical protein
MAFPLNESALVIFHLKNRASEEMLVPTLTEPKMVESDVSNSARAIVRHADSARRLCLRPPSPQLLNSPNIVENATQFLRANLG